MKFIYKDINVNYTYFNNSSDISLVYLHGWGQNIQMMMPIARPFSKKYNVVIIDLPGFGDSEEPKEIWDIYEYANMTHELLKSLKILKPIMIGHSFGGKISLCYASKYEVTKLVLLASPYRRYITKPSLKTKILKKIKNVPGLSKLSEYAKKHIGSVDYRNATPMMRDILVGHVNLDLSEDAKKIKCPTLLIWGTEDKAVLLEEALKLEELIPNAGLVTYEGCTHYAYLERLEQTISVLNNFIGGNK